jgi:Uma2 family endonuclease
MPTQVSIARGINYDLWTADEFLNWLEPGVFADLIDGEKFMHSPVSLAHADLANFLERLLAAFIEKHALGILHRETVAVRLSQRNVFMPDLAFFTTEQTHGFLPTHIPLPPTWICEVLSPRTADRDVGPKFATYEEYGVKEYWILDPDSYAHRFYARDGEIFTEFGAGEEVIRSGAIPGFWVRRSWLDPKSLPHVADAVSEIERALPTNF